MNAIQSVGRDVIQLTPEVVKTVNGEAAAHRDPYLDKRLHWLGPGGLAEADAEDHKLWVEDFTAEEKVLLARMQADGRVKAGSPSI